MTRKIEIYSGKIKGRKAGIFIACDGIEELGEVYIEIDGKAIHGYTLEDLTNGRVLIALNQNILYLNDR